MLLSSSIFSGLKRHLNVKTTGEEAACCLRAYVGKRQIRRCLSSSHVRKGGKAETICSPSNEGGKDPTDFIKFLTATNRCGNPLMVTQIISSLLFQHNKQTFTSTKSASS